MIDKVYLIHVYSRVIRSGPVLPAIAVKRKPTQHNSKTMTSEEKKVLFAIPLNKFVEMHEVWLLLNQAIPNENKHRYSTRYDDFLRIMKVLTKRDLLHIGWIDNNKVRVYKRKTVAEVLDMIII